MTSAAVVGSTGLVGSQILATLLAHPQTFPTITSFSRRPPTHTSPTLHPVVSTDPATWHSSLKTLSPTPAIFFSGLGTTRADAGSFAAQYAIDHDLNLSLAKAAKEAGVRVYVLISSANSSASSWFGYSRMKGELEDAVAGLGFECAVIVRPGLLLGRREKGRWAEASLVALAGRMGQGLRDAFAQDAEVIARAAARAGKDALEGKVPSVGVVEGKAGGKVWKVEQKDILRLGRDDWKDDVFA